MDDLAALHLLKARYFRFVDAKDWDALRELLTTDMTFLTDDLDGPPTTEPTTAGRDTFVERVAARFAEATTVHHDHMPELELTGPRTATGIWSMVDYVTNAAGGQSWRGYGFYYDQYARGDDGAWRIKVLHLRRIRIDRF